MKRIGFLATALLAITISHAQVRLPRLIRDSMILQRDTKVNIWGWASANEKVTVAFNKKTFRTTADKQGIW